MATSHSRTAVPVLTIDGPSGSGKGTVSRLLADELGWHYLDSGALYRIAALAAQAADISFNDEQAVAAHVLTLDIEFTSDEQGNEKILVDGEDIAHQVRLETTGELASQVAVLPAVRQALVEVQKNFARAPGLVADGRDMATVIFPDSPCKVFLDASAAERAERRYKQLKEKGVGVNLARLREEIEARDARDRGREIAPLKPANDALVLDSTALSIEQVVELVRERLRSESLIAG